MEIWGLRLVTFMANLIILISFIWLYVWIEQTKRQSFIVHHRNATLISLTAAFLLFFFMWIHSSTSPMQATRSAMAGPF